MIEEEEKEIRTNPHIFHFQAFHVLRAAPAAVKYNLIY